MDLEQALKTVIRVTGNKKLLGQVQEILDRSREIQVLADDPSGIVKADLALSEEESFFEKEIEPKVKLWKLKLKEIDYRGKADLTRMEGEALQFQQELDPELKEILKSVDNATRNATTEEEKQDDLKIKQALKNLYESMNSHSSGVQDLGNILKHVQDRYIPSLESLIDQLRAPLEKYKHTKQYRRQVIRLSQLAVTLFVFTLGVEAAGNTIPEGSLKLGFAVFIWAVEEFLFAPIFEKWSLRKKREDLKVLIQTLSEIKAGALIIETFITHQLKNKDIKQSS